MDAELSTTYGIWLQTITIKLKCLDKELEEKYDSETEVRLPDYELDWKYDAWRDLQDIFNDDVPPVLSRFHRNYPQSEWNPLYQSVYKILMTKEKRTCRDTVAKVLKVLD